ncbi:MAG: hypothetical protein JST26_07940 [Bacteroidetes bacterium]|nr:hypothetical protein [Bacteroidota bacterium]
MKKLYDALLISVEKRERLLAKAIELLDEADFLYAEAVKEDNLYKAHLRKINSQLGKYFKRTDNKKN